MASVPTEDERTQVLNAYKAKVMEHREMESRFVAFSPYKFVRLERARCCVNCHLPTVFTTFFALNQSEEHARER